MIAFLNNSNSLLQAIWQVNHLVTCFGSNSEKTLPAKSRNALDSFNQIIRQFKLFLFRVSLCDKQPQCQVACLQPHVLTSQLCPHIVPCGQGEFLYKLIFSSCQNLQIVLHKPNTRLLSPTEHISHFSPRIVQQACQIYQMLLSDDLEYNPRARRGTLRSNICSTAATQQL